MMSKTTKLKLKGQNKGKAKHFTLGDDGSAPATPDAPKPPSAKAAAAAAAAAAAVVAPSKHDDADGDAESADPRSRQPLLGESGSAATATHSAGGKPIFKKKVDARIRLLIENCVKLRQRSFFVIVGDRGRDQVVNLHYILSKASVKTRPNVLWCYKKELGFTTHRKKRAKKIKREVALGVREVGDSNPFELFVSGTDIRYCYYKESHRILGNTYGMCILQDFEALTPNLMARTIETVEGGGIVILLLDSMASLTELYDMNMDVHSRFKTEAHSDVVPRFNQRFLLSLGLCQHCLVVDDQLNILPISNAVKDIKKVALDRPVDEKGDSYLSPADVELKSLKASMRDTPFVGSVLESTRTLDQAKAVLTFIEAIQEKTLRSTVVLTAGRGRGKSAALGLAMASAIAHGYANVFVTAPSPENLKTLFEMVLRGFDALEYKEHTDYEIVQSTNPAFNKAVVRINIYRSHRQTIQYIQPQDANKLSQAELLVIDEAAAIPLPMVKTLLGPYLVFMSSTINGYEGTGRSLSLKLVQQLRTQSAPTAAAAATAATAGTSSSAVSGRVLRELQLDTPIRYAAGDPIEKWLNDLLCLDCTQNVAPLVTIPHPKQCELYYVNRDTLFSYHEASEVFLQRVMSLYVSSHYKNSPNDLQLLADAPAHHIFVLLGPTPTASSSSTAAGSGSGSGLPDVLCVIQVCLEGEINAQSVKANLGRGQAPSGDLIPWTLSQQFQNSDFASLSGARIVRIATHPQLQRMGYGQRAMELLQSYYEGKFTNLSESAPAAPSTTKKSKPAAAAAARGESKLMDEALEPAKNLPPLLETLSERTAEGLHYIGTSYGLTLSLFNFWRKIGYVPTYVRLTPNDLTGEHTCIMVKTITSPAVETAPNSDWLDGFARDFKRRFMSLLAYDFNGFPSSLALSVIDPKKPDAKSAASDDSDAKSSATAAAADSKFLSSVELDFSFTRYDLNRLESYSRNLVDYHLILDLVPSLARLYFTDRFDMTLSYTQAAIVMALGLQHKSVTALQKELNIESSQILALFNKAVRKASQFLRAVQERAVTQIVTANAPAAVPALAPTGISLSADLNAGAIQLQNEQKKASKAAAKAAAEEKKAKQSKQDALLQSLNLTEFAIKGSDADWDKTLSHSTKRGTTPATVSVATAAAAGGGSSKRVSTNGDANKRDKKKSKR